MHLILPAPPSLNAYYAIVPTGNFHRLVPTKEGKDYRKTLAAWKLHCGIKTLKGDLQITVDCFPKIKDKRDLDNYFKCLNDSLQDVEIIENDKYIRWQLGRMQQPYWSWPCIILEIKPIDFEPMTLPQRINEIANGGEKLVGLSLLPNDIQTAIERDRKRLF
jgi:Holliday junction resolvase RusA-like endonuclease